MFAAWVFAYHVDLQLGRPAGAGPLRPLIERGYLGVDGFFILSGLVLALAHAELRLRRQELLRFWGKRLARIYPVHLAMLALLAALLAVGLAAGMAPREPARFGLAELVRSVALVQAWGFSDRLAWNYPSWSISTEWAGYLAFPLLWLAVRGVPGRLLGLLPAAMFACLLGVGWAAGDGRLNLTYAGALGRYFPEFIAGMAIVPLAATGGRPDGRIVAVAGAALAAAAVLLPVDAVAVAGIWLALLGLLLAARQRHAPALARVPGLLGLGMVSYSFYMSFAAVEMVAAFVWRRLGTAPPAHPLAYVALVTAATLGLGLLAWRVVERPAQRRLNAALERHLATEGRGG